MSVQEIATKQDAPLADIGIGDIMLNVPLLQQIDHMAARMATSKATVPDHLRGNEGDCWAIIMQAVQWKMNPYVVAQKTHIVSGKLGYEAQLVNAVIQNSRMITGSFKYEYEGEGGALQCRVGAKLKGDDDITWGEWLSIASVTTKNSPLWKTNPKQQLGYLQVKNWARAYCPGAILGVYTPDEIESIPAEREIGAPVSDLTDAIKSKLRPSEASEAEDAQVIEDAPPPAEEPELEMPEEVAEEDMATYAQAAQQFNQAETPEEIAAAKAYAADFLATGTNAKFRDELMDVYKARVAQLQAIQDEQKES